jgi:hypothetical protein
LGIVLELVPRNWHNMLREMVDRIPAPVQGSVIAATLLLFAVLSESAAPFIYFQF